MEGVTHTRIDEIEALQGFDRVSLRRAGQEEVYVALSGSGTLEAEGETYPIDPDHIVRVGPSVRRKVSAGPDGLRLLAIGAVPGRAYDSGGTL